MRQFQLHRHTIFVTLAGSQAHGTAREGSDVDLRGVCIVPLWMRLSLQHDFEQDEGPLDPELWKSIEPKLLARPTTARSLTHKIESTVFDLLKFVKLCASANPNALEILFADERDFLYETPIWRKLYAERQRFLSLKVQETYLGYAMAQLKRIRTHRAWLLNPPRSKPIRTDFGLPEQSGLSRDELHRIEQSIAEKLRSWDIDELEMPRATRIALRERLHNLWLEVFANDELADERRRNAAALSVGLSHDVIATLEAERKYRSALRHWESYRTWQEERNSERAALEARFGFDTKHGMHLVRLMRTGLEVLQTGALKVRRSDAAELNAIRDGALSYDELLAHATELRERMLESAEHAILPRDVDREKIDELVFELVCEAERAEGGALEPSQG